MIFCCALSDYLERRRNRQNRGSDSMSDDCPSDNTDEATVGNHDTSNVGWETVTPCFCLERGARESRHHSCPSRLSPPRRLNIDPVRPRSVSVTPWGHHQSNRCKNLEEFADFEQIDLSLPSHSPQNSEESYNRPDRCAARYTRTRERRLTVQSKEEKKHPRIEQDTHKCVCTLPTTVSAVPGLDEVITNVVYYGIDVTGKPFKIAYFDEIYETPTFATCRRKKICLIKKRGDAPETTHVEINFNANKLNCQKPSLPRRAASPTHSETDSDTTTEEQPNYKKTTTVVYVEPRPIYVTPPNEPTPPSSPPYVPPSYSQWPDMPCDDENLPKVEIKYLSLPSQGSFYSPRPRKKSFKPPSIASSQKRPQGSTAVVPLKEYPATVSCCSKASTPKQIIKKNRAVTHYPLTPRRNTCQRIQTETTAVLNHSPTAPSRNAPWRISSPDIVVHSRSGRLLIIPKFRPTLPPIPEVYPEVPDSQPNSPNRTVLHSRNSSLRRHRTTSVAKNAVDLRQQLLRERTFRVQYLALPQHGHKHWQFYFSRTFDVYTKLWKYQQQHRTLLNEEYGLRRWQIGEIASKIGQLYYHFYLRTSEVTYLFDAYEFYAAIRGRGYYAKAADESNGDLMIKRLRYYTRFIVVSLLTRKLKFVEELISELDDVIMEYGDSYDPEDQIQWTMVSSEVKAFLAVECAIIIEDPECKKSLRTKTRLTPVSIPCIDKTPQMNLRLQKAVIIGSGSYQARVSELTIDMYRFLQTIEREPVQSRQVWEEPRNPFADGFDRAFNIEIATANAPEKNLLFKPSPTQALVFIASACDDLSPIGALLLYISADGVSSNTKGGEDYGFETGGLITTSKSDIYGEVRASTPARYKEIQCLHPGDLQPFTRKPLFIVVDSDHSTIFLKMRRPFEMPMVILMSPTELPPSLKEYENMGGLLTLFLYCPLGAVCRICNVDNVTADMWVEAQILINNFLQEAVIVAVRLPIDPSYICFMGDDFLRVQIARYIFCELVLRMHRGFVSRNHLPRASPPLPEQLFDNVALNEMILELATFLKIRNQFFNPLGAGGASNNN